MSLIKLENISKIYNSGQANEVQALKNVNLEILTNEFLAIMGPSGSGKSTLLNIIGGLDHATSGNYFFNDERLNGISEKHMAQIRNTYMGFIFQAFHLIPEDTVLENVMLPLIYRSGNDKDRKARALAIIDKIGLLPRVKNKANQLSTGEMQRVAIARALVKKPKIIFADEPTGNLDYKAKIEIIEILKQLQTNEQITVFLVTHDQMLISYASRKILLHSGSLIEE